MGEPIALLSTSSMMLRGHDLFDLLPQIGIRTLHLPLKFAYIFEYDSVHKLQARQKATKQPRIK